MIKLAKANKKAIESGNFWDMRIVHGMLAGKPKVNADETKRRHKKKKERIRKETKRVNNIRTDNALKAGMRFREDKQSKMQKLEIHIQYGFDLAEHWMMQHA